jgi:epoxyqueuosine reductase
VPQRRPVRLRERIRRAASELGFAQVGFAPAERPLHGAEYLEWLDRGWHGEMAYMAREDAVRRRLDPREALPDCRTLIMVSVSYGPGDGTEALSPPTDAEIGPLTDPGRPAGEARAAPAIVARYARGRDYHDVFEERLALLAERVASLAPESACKAYVDYGPVLERDHAQRAGLGWIGKNTMLIHPELGSYLLLGELLTTLKLPPDAPFTADRCGTCERCIDACPTGAIRGPRELDSRLCISCPWNSAVPAPAESPLALEPGRPVPPKTMIAWAEELSGIGEGEFKQRYRGTAFARPGRAGMLRNLAVGLGNVGGIGSEAILNRLSQDGSQLVREHAEWALERLGERPIDD